MSGTNRILSLLGLALRGGRLAVGEEPTALAAKAGQARLILAASDAAGNALRRAEHLAREGHCLWLVLPYSKAELGGALGRGGVALAALTDTGLAAAVAERLAQLDPERYGGLAQRMELKLRRAKERAAAPRRDPPKNPRGPSPRAGERRGPKPRREGDRPPRAGRGPEERRAGGPKSRPGTGSGKPGRPQGGKRPHQSGPGRAARNKGGPGPRRGGGR